MAFFPDLFEMGKDAVKKGADLIPADVIKEAAGKAAESVAGAAKGAMDTASQVKDDIEAKVTELDRMLNQAVNEYNDAYTLMSDKGVQLFIERTRAVDSIGFVESLINSIANRPKSFDADFEEIATNRSAFTGTCEFADRELHAARVAAAGAGAGLAAGASVAFMAPTAAMWVATTFGTASTGTAISALSGAAASNAALAWLGGGALAAGGGGVAAGNALLALAGPIGWTIAGATLLSSIVLFANKRIALDKQKNEEIASVKTNTEAVKELDAQLTALLASTAQMRTGLNGAFERCLPLFGGDYASFSIDQKSALGTLVNTTKALSATLAKTVETTAENTADTVVESAAEPAGSNEVPEA